MADRTLLVDMAVLEERVRAATWLVPEKGTRWRRLAGRTHEQYAASTARSSWMILLRPGTAELFAVELVPCDPGEPGSVSLQKNQSPEQIRLDAQVLYDLWEEELPRDALM
jgi:hypothetical protein